MAGRAARPNTDEEIEVLSLSAINGQIRDAKRGYETGGSSQGRKAFFKRLIWLEAHRERLHGVEAPKRRFSN